MPLGEGPVPRLGEVLANAVRIAAGGLTEPAEWRIKPETVRQLHAIWRASPFGSYNAERQNKAYFENRP
jgi:hypothetical protein